MKIDRPVMEFCKKYNIGQKYKIQIIQLAMNGLTNADIAKEIDINHQAICDFFKIFCRKHSFNGRDDVVSEIYKSVLWEIENDNKINQLQSANEKLTRDLNKIKMIVG